MVTLYSTGCPRCRVLKQKLDAKQIAYEVVDSIDKMESLGIESVPVLSVDGELLQFIPAVEWVNAAPEVSHAN